MISDECWEHEFGHNQIQKYFTRKQVSKNACNDGSVYEWDVDHILPLDFKKPGKAKNHI